MKSPVIAAVLLVLAMPAHAGMRHDRICDIAQDKADAINYNPEGGNAIKFGKCESKFMEMIGDIPIDSHIGNGGFWNSLNCGYQSYREGKRLNDSPYKNYEMIDAWKDGWKFARKSCITGQRPTFKSSDIK